MTNNWLLDGFTNRGNPGGHEVVVFIGLAAPVKTPLIGPHSGPASHGGKSNSDHHLFATRLQEHMMAMFFTMATPRQNRDWWYIQQEENKGASKRKKIPVHPWKHPGCSVFFQSEKS